MLCNGVIRRVKEKIDEVGHDDLCPLPHQHLLDVIVCNRMVLDKDFADDADLWLPQLFVDGDVVKVAHDVLHHAAELEHTAMLKFILCARHPLIERCLCRPLLKLVRHHSIAYVHQQITVDRRLDGIHHHLTAEGKAVRLLGQSAHSKDGDVREARIAQCLAQHTEIVRRAARTAGLKECDARVVGITHPCLECREQLSNDDNRGIAHIVVHIAQPQIHRCLVGHWRDDDVIAVLAHGGAEELKVNRCHLRRKDCMCLLAVLGKARTLDNGHLVIGGILPAGKCGNQ